MDWTKWETASVPEKIGMCDDHTILVELMIDEGGASREAALDLGNFSLEEAKRLALAEYNERNPR